MKNVQLNSFTYDELQFLFDCVSRRARNEKLTDAEMDTASLWLTQILSAMDERTAFEVISKN